MGVIAKYPAVLDRSSPANSQALACSGRRRAGQKGFGSILTLTTRRCAPTHGSVEPRCPTRTAKTKEGNSSRSEEHLPNSFVVRGDTVELTLKSSRSPGRREQLMGPA